MGKHDLNFRVPLTAHKFTTLRLWRKAVERDGIEVGDQITLIDLTKTATSTRSYPVEITGLFQLVACPPEEVGYLWDWRLSLDSSRSIDLHPQQVLQIARLDGFPAIQELEKKLMEIYSTELGPENQLKLAQIHFRYL